MSNDVKFTLNDAQLGAMSLLDEKDAVSFITSAVQGKLIAALNYQKKRIEDGALEMYNAMDGYLKSMNMKMPQSFGEFKAGKLSVIQDALNELGYKPNKKKNEDGSDSNESE